MHLDVLCLRKLPSAAVPILMILCKIIADFGNGCHVVSLQLPNCLLVVLHSRQRYYLKLGTDELKEFQGKLQIVISSYRR